MIDAFNPPDVWQPFGAFSMGVLQGDGQIVHLKGQVALDRDGNIVGAGDIRAQTTQVLDNMQAVLVGLGGTMADLYSLTQYVTDIEAYMTVGNIRMQYFAEPYPVTTTVQVVRLYHSDLMVEITGVAEIPKDRFKRPA